MLQTVLVVLVLAAPETEIQRHDRRDIGRATTTLIASFSFFLDRETLSRHSDSLEFFRILPGAEMMLIWVCISVGFQPPAVDGCERLSFSRDAGNKSNYKSHKMCPAGHVNKDDGIQFLNS